MSTVQGVDFRQTLSFVTDPTNYTFIAPDDFNPTYPTVLSPSGLNGGWEEGAGGNERNRTAFTGAAASLSGINFSNNSTRNFRLDLPAAGAYSVQAAFGDNGTAQGPFTAQFKDTTTVLSTPVNNASTSGADEFYDATGVQRTSHTDWVTNNAAKSLTFSTTIFRTTLSGTGVGPIATLFIQSVGGPTSINIHTGSLGYTGRIDSPGIGISLVKGTLTYTGRASSVAQAALLSKGTFSYTGRSLTPAQAVLISKGAFGYTARPLAVSQAVQLLKASLNYSGKPFVTAAGGTINIHTGSFSYTGRVLTDVQAIAALDGHLSYTGRPLGLKTSIASGHASLTYTGKPFVVSVSGNFIVFMGRARLDYNGRSLDVPEQGGTNVKSDLVITPYVRATPPSSEPATVRYLHGQLQRIQRTMSDLTDAAEQVLAQAPDTPRRGMIRYAVAPWSDTLSGEGLYIYKGPTLGWVKII